MNQPEIIISIISSKDYSFLKIQKYTLRFILQIITERSLCDVDYVILRNEDNLLIYKAIFLDLIYKQIKIDELDMSCEIYRVVEDLIRNIIRNNTFKDS